MAPAEQTSEDAAPDAVRARAEIESRELGAAIVGVGNCASSFVQGLSYYRDIRGSTPAPDLMRPEIGGYGVDSIKIVAAFDVSKSKVGRDVAEAILAPPNNTQRFAARGPAIIGDDIKSQVGATIAHRALVNLFRERGVGADRTHQLNFGGNADFLNMLERERLESKKISRTQSVAGQVDIPIQPDNIHVGPSDHVPTLTDRKRAYIRVEGTAFGGVPLNLELKLEVWDSPNSAGIVIDAVRCAKLGLDRGIGGPLVGPSNSSMKSPLQQFTDEEARQRTARFIEGRA